MATDDLADTRDGASTSAPKSEPLTLRTLTQSTSHDDSNTPFDIVQEYRSILASDPEISMPVAAIEALIALLGRTSATTAMETVSVIKTHAELLQRAVANPVPLKAGTDLFQQYLLRSLKGQAAAGAAPPLSFDETRQHLVANSERFVARAKAAREAIAARGAAYVKDGSVVLAAGGSRTVKTLLLRAADRHAERWGSPRFKVVYVMDGSADSRPAVAQLRARGVPVAEIPEGTMAYALRAARVDMAFVGTEVVAQNGGLLSRMGTFQLATLCHALKVPFYVAAETHKIVRAYPLGQADLPRCGVRQDVLAFKTDADEGAEPSPDLFEQSFEQQAPIDYTPPELISSIITEQGVKMPAAVYVLLLDLYT